MTNQEIFDTVLHGIRKQGRPSVSQDGRCLYRGPDGLKCGVGLLIDDSEYCPEMEGKSADGCSGDEKENIVCNLLKKKNIDTILAGKLQEAHDNAAYGNQGQLKKFTEEFEERMQKLAKEYGLTYSAIEAKP
jgi:hypothetical protein